MNDKKQIEEMEQYLVSKIILSKSWKPRDIIEDLTNMIIPKDSVVLAREEYENLGLTLETVQEYETINGQTQLIKERKTLKKIPPDSTTLTIYGELLKQTNKVEMYQRLLDEMGDKLEQIRKKTAKEILEKIKEVKTQDCGYTDWLDDTYFGDEYQKLAKQYGVDLGE